MSHLEVLVFQERVVTISLFRIFYKLTTAWQQCLWRVTIKYWWPRIFRGIDVVQFLWRVWESAWSVFFILGRLSTDEKDKMNRNPLDSLPETSCDTGPPKFCGKSGMILPFQLISVCPWDSCLSWTTEVLVINSSLLKVLCEILESAVPATPFGGGRKESSDWITSVASKWSSEAAIIWSLARWLCEILILAMSPESVVEVALSFSGEAPLLWVR